MAIDPICGMTVDPETALWRAAGPEGPVWFCCRGCRDRWRELSPESRRDGVATVGSSPRKLVQLSAPPRAAAARDEASSAAARSSDIVSVTPPSDPPSPMVPSLPITATAGCCSTSARPVGSDRTVAATDVEARYFCPCCPGVGQDEPGDCPRCGMPLQPNPAFVPLSRSYVCPMHPEVRRDRPGNCPECGMALEGTGEGAGDDPMGERDMRRRMIVAGLFAVALLTIAMGPMLGMPLPAALHHGRTGWLQLLLVLPIVLWAGLPLWHRAIRSVQVASPNMFTLVALGTWSALGLSLVALTVPDMLPAWTDSEHGSLYFESAGTIVALVLFGQWLEIRARRRVQTAFAELLSLRPTLARLIDDDREIDVPIEQLQIGDRLRVVPGARVPLDGLIVEGTSQLDESMVTGESEPQRRSVGDPVVGGTVNGEGVLVVRVTHGVHDTLLARIVESVARAQHSRAPIQRIADRVAARFVPAVLLAALAAAGGWIVFGSGNERFVSAAVAAISVLLIACPCALGLAVPVSIMVAVGRAAREGVLIKDGGALQSLASIDRIVFDKTGTLTRGRMEVSALRSSSDVPERTWLAAAAAIERGSEHPIARALIGRAEREGVSLPSTDGIEVVPGEGIRARIDEDLWSVGRDEWLMSLGIAIPDDETVAAHPGTAVRVARGQTLVGTFLLADPIASTAPAAVVELKRQGIAVELASGDRAAAVSAIARSAGIDRFSSRVTPDGKLALIRERQSAGERVAMVGDGINDAPSLAAADVGIAMGSGTDVAIETADVSLVSGDPASLVVAVRLARLTMRNIRQNLLFAFAYNALGIPIAAGVLYPWLGLTLSPMLAAAAMSLSSVSVLANALRLRTLPLGNRLRLD